MRSEKQPRTYYAFGLGLLGFGLGLLVVVVSTGLAIFLQNLAFSLDTIVQLHLTELFLWVIDAIPFLMAIPFGIIGGKLDAVTSANRQSLFALHQRNTEIKGLREEVSAQEQAREQLDQTIGRGKRDWEATFDAVGDMILITDVGGKVLRCNRATSHALREGFENLIGRQIDDLFFGALHGGQFPIPAERTEMRFQKLDGWFEVSTNPIMVEEGRAATIYVIRDVTDRKQSALDLSRQKEYYEALVRNSPFAIVTLNLDSRAIACNPAFEEIFGYSEMDILGQDIDALVTPSEMEAETQALMVAVRRGEVVHKVTRRQRKDGSRLDVEVYGIPVVLWGKQIGILALYHDISKLVAGVGAGVGAEQEESLPTGPASVAPPSQTGPASLTPPSRAGVGAGQEESPPTGPTSGAPPSQAGIESDIGSGVGAGQEESPPTGPTSGAPPSSTSEPLPASVTKKLVTSPAPPQEEDTEPVTILASEAAAETITGSGARDPDRMPVESIEGIGRTYSSRLGQASIRYTADLLEAGATRAGRRELAEKTGLSPKLILRWVNIADLIRITGIGEEYSQLLEAAGVDTVKELRNRVPEHLHQAILDINQKKDLVRRPPHLSEVEAWVEAARQTEPIVEY